MLALIWIGGRIIWIMSNRYLWDYMSDYLSFEVYIFIWLKIQPNNIKQE